MSTSLRSEIFVFMLLLLVSANVAYSATPEELDARLLRLNEKVFSINSAVLSEQELAYYEEAKRYLEDAQLNLNYAAYDVAEELLDAAEASLNLIESGAGAKNMSSSDKILLAILVIIIGGVLVFFIWLLASKARKPNQLPPINVIPQELTADKCPVCSGRVYKNVCVWCSFDYYKNARAQKSS